MILQAGHITNHVCPQYFKSKREDVTGQERGQNTNIHLQPWDDKQFELKCPKGNYGHTLTEAA